MWGASVFCLQAGVKIIYNLEGSKNPKQKESTAENFKYLESSLKQHSVQLIIVQFGYIYIPFATSVIIPDTPDHFESGVFTTVDDTFAFFR